MFNKVVISDDEKFSPIEKRFASILDLVADECIDATLYIYGEWAKKDLIEKLGLLQEDAPSMKKLLPEDHPLMKKIEQTYGDLDTSKFNPSMPIVAYTTQEEWDSKNEDHNLPIHTPTDQFVYSRDYSLCTAVLRQQGLSAQSAILILAASGIDISLPNIEFDRLAKEEILIIKEQLKQERSAYLNAITALADEAYDRMSSGVYKDMYDWSKNEARFKIAPKVIELKSKLELLNKSLLDRAGTKFWNDGIPAIAKAFTEPDKKVSKVMAEESIKLLSTTLAKSIEERRVPEATYILRLAEAKYGRDD